MGKMLPHHVWVVLETANQGERPELAGKETEGGPTKKKKKLKKSAPGEEEGRSMRSRDQKTRD